MQLLPLSWSKSTKKIVTLILASGALAGALLSIKQFVVEIIPSTPEEYTEATIPLVYEDIKYFTEFLDRNDGKKVTIKSAIALDAMFPVNELVHEVCAMDSPEETDISNRKKVKSFYSFGIPEFSNDFVAPSIDEVIYDEKTEKHQFPERVYSQINCLNTMRIELIDPSTFRWSYGGTGIRSLPLNGTFRVTRRFYSGPSIEYTLRQLQE